MVKSVVRVHTGEGVIRFTIQSNKELDNETREQIQAQNFIIYWDNKACEHYSLDTKLANGLWLENITFNNDLTKAEALILN